MWTCLDPNGSPVYWNPSWDAAVTWAMKQGGDLDVLFQPYFQREGQLTIDGDIDIHGDLT